MTGGLRLLRVLHHFTYLVILAIQILVVLEQTIVHTTLVVLEQTIVRQVLLAVLLITQEQ